MTDKENFCRSFDWEIDIGWFDLTGYSPIDKNRRAKIELDSVRISGQYQAFRVTILDKNDGPVDKKTFLFTDYLGSEKTHTSPVRGEEYKVVSHCGWVWHIVTPKSTRPICEAIEKYIGVFK